MLFSLILATYGRSVELGHLFESLIKQDVGLDKFEVIVIDQNDKIDLTPVISKYSKLMHIKHIKSATKGLSYNRNIGIREAHGQYICFPDDDCTYYPDTLSTVWKRFKESKANAVFGAIRDRNSGENIIRNWPLTNKKLTRYNFFSLYSSITIFSKRNTLQFNDNLGAGCYFGACEDSEYAYSLIKEFGECYYFSDIEVWHPKVGIEQFTKEKNFSYGLGFGAFCALHKFDLFILRLFFMALGYHFTLGFISLIKGDRGASSRRFDAVVSRFKGFIECLTR